MKATLKWVLALMLVLAMAVNLLPAAGVLASDLEEEILGEEEGNDGPITYYVATNGSDTDGDGSEEKPFASVQKALNRVDTDNMTPVTILIADGAYNVYVEPGSANNVVADSSATRGHTLMIAKNNVTLKAINPGKAILYSYMDPYPDTASQHCYAPTIRFGECQNFVMDGLTVLPSFTNASGYSFTTKVKVSTLKDYLNVLLPGVTTDFDRATNIYLNNNNPMIQMNSYYSTPDNGDTKTTSGLTIMNCNIGYEGQTMGALGLDSAKLTGDYHLINNVIWGTVQIANGVGNQATVANEIVGNKINGGITISGKLSNEGKGTSFEKLPVISGNTFGVNKATVYDAQDRKTTAWLVNWDVVGSTYTDGALSAIAHSNFDESGNYLAYSTIVCAKKSTGVKNNAVMVYATDDSMLTDKVMDTEEELACYLSQNRTVTLNQNFALNAPLPENMPAKLVMGEYSITKPAELESPAPNGYCWYNGTDLAPHTHGSDYAYDELTHWHVCTNCGGRAKEVEHTPQKGDGKCDTIIRCTVCTGVVSYGKAHSWDADCTTDDACSVPGCGVKATKQAAHRFDEHATNCYYPGCAGTREVEHFPSAEYSHDAVSHWQACTYPGCDARLNESRHTAAEDDFDCTTDICCVTCGEVMIEGNDQHTVNKDCTKQGVCTLPSCRATIPAAAGHTYDHDHDVECNVPGCNGTREAVHTAGTEWLFDAYTHWNACTGEGCEAKLNVTPHTKATELSYDAGIHWYACLQAGCAMQHDWKFHSWDADCTTADVCTVEGCPAVAAASEVHTWDKDCTSADACKTEGCEVKAPAYTAHAWDSDCTTADICTNKCGTSTCTAKATAQEEHSWDRDCLTPDPCTVCGTVQVPKDHLGWDKDCTTFNICEECRSVSPASSTHNYDCTTNGMCQNEGCVAQARSLSAHKFDKDCTTADQCSRCTVVATTGHNYEDGVCTVCKAVETEEGPDEPGPTEPGTTTPGTTTPTPNNDMTTILIVVIAVAAVVVIAAVVVVIVVLKKSKKANDE